MSDLRETARELAAWDCPGECVAECAHSGLMCPKHRDVILTALTTVERETAQRCAEIAEDLCEFRTRDAITKEFGL